MTYGLNSGLFIEDGPAVSASKRYSERSSARFRAWRKLNPDHRLKIVERALSAPANDLIDDLPVAL